MFAKSTVTLYIDDNGLKLLVAKGKQVKKWAALSLEPGLVKDGVILEQAKVAAKIKEFFHAQEIPPGKIIVGLSGLHSLTRPISIPNNLPKALLGEAVRKEAEKVLPVPVDQLYLSWQTIYASEGKKYIFVAALPRSAADAAVRTIRQAGLEPELIDIKPLVLARMVGETMAIIVDVQPNEFDIVIMAYGIPQPIRTLALPQSATSWQQKLPIIIADLDRTIKFYNSGNPGKTLDATLPVFVSGDLAQATEACQVIEQQIGHPVMPLSTLLKSSDQLDTSHYMVNIGLALKKTSHGKTSGVETVNLNFLPDVYLPKPFPFSKLLLPASLIIAVGILGYLTNMVQGASAEASAIQSKLDETRQILKQKQTSQKAQRDVVTKLEQQVAALEGTFDKLSAAKQSFSASHERINGDLNTANSLRPDSSVMTLTSIRETSSDLVIKGASDNETTALEYARALRESNRFSLVTVSRLAVTTDNGTQFDLSLKVKEK